MWNVARVGDDRSQQRLFMKVWYLAWLEEILINKEDYWHWEIVQEGQSGFNGSVWRWNTWRS